MALLFLILAYLLGSIPFGLLVAKAAKVGDLRTQGSGNIGATNMARVAGRKLGFITLLLDGGKGALAVWLATLHGAESVRAWAGFLAVAGHCFPVWLHFRGGKGVATAMGVWLAYLWLLGFFACGVWLAAFALTRVSAKASLAAAATAPLYAWLLTGGMNTPGFLMTLVIALLVIARHRGNIARMRKGEEKSFP